MEWEHTPPLYETQSKIEIKMARYLSILILLLFTINLWTADGAEGGKKRAKWEMYSISRIKDKDIPIILYRLNLKDDVLTAQLADVVQNNNVEESTDAYLYVSNDTVAICCGPCADTLCKDAHLLGYMMINDRPLVVVSKTLFPESISFKEATAPLDFPFNASYGSIDDSLAPTQCIIIKPSNQ